MLVVESGKVPVHGGPDDMTFFAKFHKNLGVWLARYWDDSNMHTFRHVTVIN
jgi:hypothetical protein